MTVRSFPKRPARRAQVRELHPIPVDQSIVASAERPLAEAKAGDIRSLVIVGSMNRSRDVFRVTHRNGDPFQILGALFWAQQCVSEDIE